MKDEGQRFRGALSLLAMALICVVVWFGLNEIRDITGRQAGLIASVVVFVAALVTLVRK